MMAWTSPAFTVRSRPLRICRSSTLTCRFLISSIANVLKSFLSHAALERDRDQLLSFDRELHRQLLQNILDETVDHQRGRLLGGEPALHAVEQHLLGDLRSGGFVLEHP